MKRVNLQKIIQQKKINLKILLIIHRIKLSNKVSLWIEKIYELKRKCYVGYIQNLMHNAYKKNFNINKCISY